MISCLQGQLLVVKKLIEKGADVNLKDNKGQKALMKACQGSGSSEILQILIDNGAKFGKNHSRDINGNNCLMMACLSRNLEAIKFILKTFNYPGMNSQNNGGSTALMMTCDRGDLDIVQIMEPFLEKKVLKFKDKKGWNALMMACRSGNHQIVKILLHHKVAINRLKSPRTPLVIACQHGHHSTVSILLEKGARLEPEGNNGVSPVLVACGKRSS